MAPSGISLNKPATVTILVLVVGGIILYRWGWSPSSPAPDVPDTKSKQPGSDIGKAGGAPGIMNIAHLPDIPASVSEKAKSVKVLKTSIDVEMESKKLKIFSRQTSPETTPKLTILLLHGQAFTSNNWEEIGTLQTLTAMGYSTVAVDLPGYGQSKEASVSSREGFMAALVAKLGLPKPPVIVSPSMSGGFALPYLFADPATSTSRATAYIPVAPVSSGSYLDKYPDSQLQTLIVYGEKDKSLGEQSRADLKRLPKSVIAVIPDAGHACYMNQPLIFHKVLQQFLDDVAKH